MGQALIRNATSQDIDALIDLYVECFPERIREIFGGPHRRTFIRDYLRFYLSWDPEHNWVYVKDGAIVAALIAPCCYSPWRAALSHGQLFRWLGHLVSGEYGFPLHIVKSFLIGGFAFTSNSAIRHLWGKPYIHAIMVKPTARREPSRGLLGIGRELLGWMLDNHRKKGICFWWAVVQPTTSRFIPVWRRLGFRISPISNGHFLALWGEADADMRHSECR
jgi:hypothetical protein